MKVVEVVGSVSGLFFLPRNEDLYDLSFLLTIAGEMYPKGDCVNQSDLWFFSRLLGIPLLGDLEKINSEEQEK